MPIELLFAIAAALGFAFGGFQYLKSQKLIRQRRIKREELEERKPQEIFVPSVTEAQTKAKELLLNAKDEAFQIKKSAEDDARSIRQEALKIEQRLLQKEEKLEQRLEMLQKREAQLVKEQGIFKEKVAEIERIKQEQFKKLESIASLNREEAKNLILSKVEKHLEGDVAKKIKQAEDIAQKEAESRVKEILVEAMRRGATDYVAEYTTSVVKLPDEEMKGRVIGREGRNIRTFENLTGVNVDLDDTPGEIRLSCFDPIRREIAKVSLERLVIDGRIQPARIEEVVKKTQKDIELIMHKEGEKLCHEIGVYNLPRELMNLLGRFKYRYSYGQNMIIHTLEETKISMALAREVGADVNVVRLACLLHDIGKVSTEEEGTHIQLGVDLLRKYKLPQKVIDCVAEHHEDRPFSSIESVLVFIADAISSSRPGARFGDYESYVKRLEELEKAAESFKGVEKVFAISAGREVRVVVKPSEVDDLSAYKLAHDIAEKIERELVYPGQVKVTVIREVKAEEVAK